MVQTKCALLTLGVCTWVLQSVNRFILESCTELIAYTDLILKSLIYSLLASANSLIYLIKMYDYKMKHMVFWVRIQILQHSHRFMAFGWHFPKQQSPWKMLLTVQQKSFGESNITLPSKNCVAHFITETPEVPPTFCAYWNGHL